MEREDIHVDEHQKFCSVLDEMKGSMSSVRQVIKMLRDKQSTNDLDTKDGISLLSLKHHILLSYLHSLTLVSSRRALGHTLVERSLPKESFSNSKRLPRGSEPGDLIDSMIEGRVVLEKIKTLESRMRYQIEKLVRIAEETPGTSQNILNDPLAFRPNPANLINNDDEGSDSEVEHNERAYTKSDSTKDGIYHPPRLAPVPYTDAPKDKKVRRQPLPSALSSLMHQDPSLPHVESTSGLGAMPSFSSDRARKLQQITEFEEGNFTRVMLGKKAERRRRQDEEDIALGGTASGGAEKGRRRGGAGGLEDELGDVLRSVGRTARGGVGGLVGDGYEELRNRGKKRGALERSRAKIGSVDKAVEGDGDDAPRMRKRTRFELETKVAKKKLRKGRL